MYIAGKILKHLFILYLIFISVGSFAQQGLQMDFTEQDSAQMNLQRQMEYFQLVNGLSLDVQLLNEPLSLPELDPMAVYYDRYKLHLEFSPLTNFVFGGISSGMFSPIYSPFYNSGRVLSAAAYQLGNKFTLGGFSYGANSIFSTPTHNNGMNNFDSYGSTIFMQYKVSKNFKIETRVNVQQGAHPPGF